MPAPLPPDKYIGYDLSSYTTLAERAAAISTLVQGFYTEYGVYPDVQLDSIVNGVYLGAYGD